MLHIFHIMDLLENSSYWHDTVTMLAKKIQQLLILVIKFPRDWPPQQGGLALDGIGDQRSMTSIMDLIHLQQVIAILLLYLEYTVCSN